MNDKDNKREYVSIRIPRWNLAELNGYQPKTTFWDDFSIAEHFGLEAIKDTYRRAFREWKDDPIYLTELVLVLNHKIWFWYDRDMDYATLYNALWSKADAYASDNLIGEDLEYFYQVTD